jgi:hypothetical protein
MEATQKPYSPFDNIEKYSTFSLECILHMYNHNAKCMLSAQTDTMKEICMIDLIVLNAAYELKQVKERK